LIYNNDILLQLKELPAFKSFEDKGLEELLRNSEIREYSSKERIIEEGTNSGVLYYLVSGKVEVSKKGKQISVMDQTGALFGEMSFIDGAARSASVIAVEHTMCLEMDLARVQKIKAADKNEFKNMIYREFAEVLAGRLRVSTNELIKVREDFAKSSAELEKAKLEILSLKTEK
ncbi:cyclic nucleotide-binding domain-containing protein, partial [Desulfobacterales bacterium HSG16]|nr:cyclic nucleotide-binding domain-containing protein [Desulfobacterales bacterium HSG16]